MGNWGYNPLLIGNVTPVTTGRGPPCEHMTQFGDMCHVFKSKLNAKSHIASFHGSSRTGSIVAKTQLPSRGISELHGCLMQSTKIWVSTPKQGENPPKWMVYNENNGKPYEQMDDLGKTPLFLETPISLEILLMAEILHHVGCKKPVENNGIKYLSNGAGFQPSTVGVHPLKKKERNQQSNLNFKMCLFHKTQMANISFQTIPDSVSDSSPPRCILYPLSVNSHPTRRCLARRWGEYHLPTCCRNERGFCTRAVSLVTIIHSIQLTQTYSIHAGYISLRLP